MVILSGASKFATAKIGLSFEMGKLTPLGVPFILLLLVPLTCIYIYIYII